MSEQPSAAATAIAHYSDRAAGYDDGAGGWHIELGLDFAKWLSPEPGAAALDLACGTGLVTIPLAEAVGKAGVVIGVDITTAMLNEARKKPTTVDAARVTWIEHDITELEGVAEVKQVVAQRGGFDSISCCSALGLLPDAGAAIKSWAKLLAHGGNLIIDVPTEEKTLQHLATVQLRAAVGLRDPFDRSWTKGIHSLEQFYQEAGLEIQTSFKTRSYLSEKLHEADQAEKVFDQQIQYFYKEFEKKGKLERAREAWPSLWVQNLRDDGKIYEGHPLYVVIGRKP